MSAEEGQHSKRIIVKAVKSCSLPFRAAFHFEEISQASLWVPKKHLWTDLLCLLVFKESSAETFLERTHKCCCESPSVTNNITLFGLLQRPGLAERETAAHTSFNNYTSTFFLWHVKVTFAQRRQDELSESHHQSRGILFLLCWKITLKEHWFVVKKLFEDWFKWRRLSASWSASECKLFKYLEWLNQHHLEHCDKWCISTK